MCRVVEWVSDAIVVDILIIRPEWISNEYVIFRGHSESFCLVNSIIGTVAAKVDLHSIFLQTCD